LNIFHETLAWNSLEKKENGAIDFGLFVKIVGRMREY
jgi:hypothetical protein